MIRSTAAAVLLAALLCVAGPAAANPMDTFGYTARGIGLGGAMTAAASSYDATYYNPAGLGMLQGFDLGVGASAWRTFLKTRTTRRDDGTSTLQRVTSTRDGRVRGMGDIGLASPVPLGKGLDRHLFLGASIAVPGATLYAVRARPVEQPYFPFLEDRNRRLVLNAAAAGRWKWLMVGAGISFLPAVRGQVDVDFTDGDTANRTSVDVDASLSANVGVLVEPLPGLTVGLCWRGENRTDVDIPVNAVLSDKIAPVLLRVTAVDWSTPHQVALGVAYKADRWAVTGDVTYSVYRRFRLSSPQVLLYGTSGNGDVIKDMDVPGAGFHDTWAVRVGGEFKPHPAVALRAGFGWVQSPVPAQTGTTNLLDGDRLTGSLGLGFDASALKAAVPVAVDVAVQGGGLLSSRDAKDAFDPANPGYPWVQGTAWYLAGTLSAKVTFK